LDFGASPGFHKKETGMAVDYNKLTDIKSTFSRQITTNHNLADRAAQSIILVDAGRQKNYVADMDIPSLPFFWIYD
jgi:hypothetical protein